MLGYKRIKNGLGNCYTELREGCKVLEDLLGYLRDSLYESQLNLNDCLEAGLSGLDEVRLYLSKSIDVLEDLISIDTRQLKFPLGESMEDEV